MKFKDQKAESLETTADVEKAKTASEFGRRKAQLDERPEKTKEVEEAKKKGK